MALGVARQMDRCRTVGNSVVPICVGVAWRVLTGLRHAVNPRDTPAPPPSRSKHRLDPNRRVPLMTPDPRVRPNWDGGGGNEAPWKPWSVPWPTFFAPVQNESPSTDPRTDPQTGSKRKRQEGGDGGQTESETAATPDDRGDVPSPPVLDKLEPWGETEEAKARRLEARRGGGTQRRSTSSSPAESRQKSKARSAAKQTRTTLDALVASPDVRNGASALLRQLWESTLRNNAEYRRVAETLRSPAAKRRAAAGGDLEPVRWTAEPPPRLFPSPAEVRDGRVAAEERGRTGLVVGVNAREDQDPADAETNAVKSEPGYVRGPMGLDADGVEWPRRHPISHPDPSVVAGMSHRDDTHDDTHRHILDAGTSVETRRPSAEASRFVFAVCAVSELTNEESESIRSQITDPIELEALSQIVNPPSEVHDDPIDTADDGTPRIRARASASAEPFKVACLRGLEDGGLLAAAFIRPASGEGILGRYVEMPFLVTLPHARGRGLWRELTRLFIGWATRHGDWRATGLIVKVARPRKGARKGERHWQEAMWRDGFGACRLDGGWGGGGGGRRATNAGGRIETILRRLGSNAGAGESLTSSAGESSSAAAALHPTPGRDLLLLRMLPPPDEGSDGAPSPLYVPPAVGASSLARAAALDESRAKMLASSSVPEEERGHGQLLCREHAMFLDFVTRVIGGHADRGVSLSLFGYYEPKPERGTQPQGVPAALRLRVEHLDRELLLSGGGPGTFLACAHACLLRETLSNLLPGAVVDWGAWSDVVSQGNFPAAVKDFLARRERLAAAAEATAGSHDSPIDGNDVPNSNPPPAVLSPGTASEAYAAMNVRDRCETLLSLLRIAVKLDVGGVRSAAAAVDRAARVRPSPDSYAFASTQRHAAHEVNRRPLAHTIVCRERAADGTTWTYRVIPASLDTGRSFAFVLVATAPVESSNSNSNSGGSERGGRRAGVHGLGLLGLDLDVSSNVRWRRVAAAYGAEDVRLLARSLRKIADASNPADAEPVAELISPVTGRPRPSPPSLPPRGRVACMGPGDHAACIATAELLHTYAAYEETRGTEHAVKLSNEDLAVLVGESPFSSAFVSASLALGAAPSVAPNENITTPGLAKRTDGSNDTSARWLEPNEVPLGTAPERPAVGREHVAERVFVRVRRPYGAGGDCDWFPPLGLMEPHVDATYTREIGAIRLLGLTHSADTMDANAEENGEGSSRPECPVSGAEFVHLASGGSVTVAQRHWMRHVDVVHSPVTVTNEGPDAAASYSTTTPLEDWLASRGEALGGDDASGLRVLVSWPADGACYPATVEKFRNVGGNVGHHGAHAVRYDDGHRETVHLALQTFCPLEPVGTAEHRPETADENAEDEAGPNHSRGEHRHRHHARLFDRVCWFAPRGDQTVAGWRKERRRRVQMRPRGLDVEARNVPAAAEDAGPGVPNVDEDPGPEEEDEGIIESGGVGTRGRKRRRMDDGNEDDAEDGNEPPD